MKDDKVGQGNHNLKKRLLAVSITSLLLQFSSSSYAGYTEFDDDENPVGSPIGDLQVYQEPKSGAIVTMMIDASGSMSVLGQYNYDIPGRNGKYYWNNPGQWPVEKFYNRTDRSGNIIERNVVLDLGSNSVYSDYGRICGYAKYLNGKNSATRHFVMPSWINSNIVYRYFRVAKSELSGYRTNIPAKVKINDKDVSYNLSGCKMGKWVTEGSGSGRRRVWQEGPAWADGNTNPYRYLDRAGRVKHALIQTLGQYTAEEAASGYIKNGKKVSVQAGDYRIKSNNVMGLGAFGIAYYTASDRSKIIVPAKKLTVAHRLKLVNEIESMVSKGNTPTAAGLGEAAAYMLGSKVAFQYADPNSTNAMSGFLLSTEPDIRTASNDAYKKPVSDKNGNRKDAYKCYSQGIFLLTDGVPTNYRNVTGRWLNTINGPLSGSSLPDFQVSNPVYRAGWAQTGLLAKKIRDYTDDKKDIRTATLAFGSNYKDALNSASSTIKNQTITMKGGETRDIINCDIFSRNEKNLCLLGTLENYTKKGQDTWEVMSQDKRYGGGGFYIADSSNEVRDAVMTFVEDLEPETKDTPSGTILIPEDPFRGNTVTPYAYLPVVKPNLSGKKHQIWQGNLKKYSTDNGTLYGLNKKRLYTARTATDSGGEIKDDVADLWSTQSNASGNSSVHSGGFYAQLIAPSNSSVGSTRNIFIQSNGKGSSGGLMKVSVDSAGKPVNFTNLTDSVFGSNDAELRQSHRKILQFLGYNIPLYDIDSNPVKLDSIPTDLYKMSGYAPDKNHSSRLLGATLHSTPALAAYSVKVDAQGRLSTLESDRDEYLLFGTMDGALHLVDAESGKEKWAIILKEMFRAQPEALTQGAEGSLKFGVDAPWLVSAKYNYSATGSGSGSSKVELFQPSSGGSLNSSLLNSQNYVPMAAYGGFRYGSRGLVALDLSKSDKPKMLFNITADTTANNKTGESPVLHNSKGKVSKNTDAKSYNNIGHIWSKPTIAKMNDSTSKSKPFDVLVFGGGYDMRYEHPKFTPDAVKDKNSIFYSADPKDHKILGSSVYIADAKTGKYIWHWNNPYNHSIVGGVTVLDRNNDGYFDHLYFADLGGNVFRVDFENSKTKVLKQVRQTRIFNASAKVPAGKKYLAYRFYQRPVVSFYKDEADDVFALVNIASGDRSSPMSNLRSDNNYANKVYGIIDREIASVGLMKKKGGSYPAAKVANLTQSNLVKLGGAEVLAASPSKKADRAARLCESIDDLCSRKVSVISDMLDIKNVTLDKKRTIKDGWYYNLTAFSGYENVSNLKAVGESTVIASKLYLSVFDNSAKDFKAEDCKANHRGLTESQLYCLPYGVCMHGSSITGFGGGLPAGKGIQELTLGAFNDKNTDAKALIGTSTYIEREVHKLKYGKDKNKKPGNNIVVGGGSGQPTTDSDALVGGGNNYSGADLTNGGGTPPNAIERERFVLTPQEWFEALD